MNDTNLMVDDPTLMTLEVDDFVLIDLNHNDFTREEKEKIIEELQYQINESIDFSGMLKSICNEVISDRE